MVRLHACSGKLSREKCGKHSLLCLLDHGTSGVAMNKVGKAAQMLSKLGASKGGEARAKKLSPERRKAIAQKAAKARWATIHKPSV